MSKVENALCGFKERHSLEYKRSIVVTLLCIGRFAELPRELFHLILSHALDALHTAPACGVYGVRWREIEALPEGDRCTFAGVEPCKVAQELALMHHALLCSIELCEFILWEREQPQGNSSEEERLEFFSRERSPLRRYIAAFKSVRICSWSVVEGVSHMSGTCSSRGGWKKRREATRATSKRCETTSSGFKL